MTTLTIDPATQDVTIYVNENAPGTVSPDNSVTLTNKSISLANNTITGTKAQFNTACSDADFATLAGTETLTNKTLTAPVLGTPASGNLSNCTADGTNLLGFLAIPQNSQSTAYTCVLADAGKHILHPRPTPLHGCSRSRPIARWLTRLERR